MKLRQYLNLAFALLFAFLQTACDKDEPDPQSGKARRTVVMYMIAENSLSGYPNFMEADLAEIFAAKDQVPLDCNLVVYVDDRKMPTIYTYGAQTGQSVWKTLPEQNSCDSLMFRTTLADIVQSFPAEQYGLILWSHGSGWIQEHGRKLSPVRRRSFGIDNNMNTPNNSGSELEIPVMARMLKQLGVHWDYIFFDACFMQCVEVDYELRNVCDYIVASPAEIPGNGAPYDVIMKSLFLNKGAATSIATNYYKTYTRDSGLIISVAQTSEMENLAQTMRQFVPQLFAGRRQYSLDGAQFYCPFTSFAVWKPEYFDLGSAMNLLLSSPSDYEILQRQLERSYPVRLHTPQWMSEFYDDYMGDITDPTHVACVSMFFPHSKYSSQRYNNYLHDLQWYKAAGWDETGW